MAKTIKDSTKQKDKASKVNKHEEDCYAHPRSKDKIFYSEDAIRLIGEQAIEFFTKEPKAIRIKDFLAHKELYANTWDTWKNKYAFLKEQEEYCKMLIANKREHGMVFLDEGQREGPHIRVMHRYDNDWKEIDRYHAELKAQAAQKALEAAGGGAGITKIVTVEVDRVKIDDPVKSIQAVENK